MTAADVSGTYALATINGQPMPTLDGRGAGITSTIVADTVVLAGDGTWSDQAVLGSTTSPAVGRERVYTGTWTFDPRTAVVLETQPLPHGQTSTTGFHVRGRVDALTFDAGPVMPYNYGSGLWVYTRVR